AEKLADKKGVGIDYAVGWSLAPSELLDLVIPRFHGGSSMEIYDGKAAPQVDRGRKIPNVYWGQMPFTQSYEYFGIILLFLALFGLIANWKKSAMAKALLVALILAVLLSFGKHFIVFYKIFFNYVPFFDKFRVPMMIVTLIFFIVLIGAGYGITSLSSILKTKDGKKLLYGVIGFTVFIFLISLIVYRGADFMSARDKSQGPNQTIEIYQKIRQEIAANGLVGTFIFFVSMVIVILLLIKEKIKKEVAFTIILLLQLIDLFPMDVRYFKVHGEFKDVKKLKQNALIPGKLENTLMQDKSRFRVLPFGRLQQSNDWSNYFESVGGYSPAKLQTIQNVIENNLYKSIDGRVPINWNVLDILNVKYVYLQQELNHPQLEYILNDKTKGVFVYRYTQAKPRVFPVGEIKTGLTQKQILHNLNSPKF
ncbi:MAG: PucC family protein, partial [Calditrichia bacterium]|nr:PucC family protein [Calditrichia bacterium]